MKVLHIICDLKNGGAQRLLSDILPFMKKSDLEVSVLTFDGENTELMDNLRKESINVYSLNSKNIRNPLNIIKLKKFLKNYDIIHSHTTTPQLYLALVSLFNKNKIITTEHSTSNKRRNLKWYRPIDRLMYNRYDKIICISDSTKKNLLEWTCSKDISKYEVVNNGVDLERFKITPTSLNIEVLEGMRLVTMVSRFAPAKDHATLIKAIPYINSSDVKFILVGEGETKAKMENLVKELNIAEKCFFLGNRNDIPNIVANSYIGVQSSFWDGFGLTAVEFMAAGKPIIASDVDGLKQVVEGAGLIFKQGDEQQLAHEINRLLDDNMLYDEISKRCIERAKNFDINKMAESYISIYEDLLKE